MELDKITKLQRRYPEELMKAVLCKPMLVVTAPSGYGKTTVVRSFLAKHPEVGCVWISLNEDEPDDNWLWQKICRQFKGLSMDAYGYLRDLGLPATGQSMELLIQIISENLKRPVCLVLDDFQECHSKIIHYILVRLVQAEIPHLHILVISRARPEFPLEEMMLKGYCSVIDQQALTLSREETAEIYECNGVKLTEEELDQLNEYTDGWIAAVYLTLLDYKRQGYFRLSMDMVRLLKTAIFDKFPYHIQQVLMKMSLFDSFTLAEANFVTENDLQEFVLQVMMETYGFGHYEVRDGKYTVHSLLRTVARAELDRSGADQNLLLYRDGQWNEKCGNLIQAVIAYRRCHATERILALLSGKYRRDMYDAAPYLFEEFFLELPLELRLQYPSAYLSYIYLLGIQYDAEQGRRLFEEAQEGYRRLEGKLQKEEYEKIQGELFIIRALLEFNDLDRMTEHMKQAARLLKYSAPSIFEGNLLTHGTPFTLHLYHRRPGDLQAVVEKEKEYTRYFMKLIQRVDGGLDDLYDAEYMLTTGNVEKALELAVTVGEKAGFRRQTCVVVSSYNIRLWGLIYLGRVSEFEQALQELRQEMKEIAHPVFVIDYELTIGGAYARLNRLDEVPEWIMNFDLEECSQIVRSVRIGCMTYGIVLRQKKQWIRLDALAEQMMVPYEKTSHLYVLIEAYIFKAIAALHLEGEHEAVIWLERALQAAEEDKIAGDFIENAQELLPLLEKMSSGNRFAGELIPYCRTYVKNIVKFRQKEKSVQLTERELEIMQLVKEGCRNNEISERLHVALVTVEKSLTHIYRKLGVSNRASAVAKVWGGGRDG